MFGSLGLATGTQEGDETFSLSVNRASSGHLPVLVKAGNGIMLLIGCTPP